MLLENLKKAEYTSAAEVNQEYAELLETFKEFLNNFAQLDESHMTPIEGDLEQQLIELEKRFSAAKRGLGLVNKLPAGMERSAHARRIMGNLNTIRAQLGHVIRAVNDSASTGQAEFERAARGYEYAEQEEAYEEECPVCMSVECIC